MSRSDRRVLRKASEGVTWAVTPRGGSLLVEIVFDDEPEKVVRRELAAKDHGGVEGLIAEQVADGFILEPRWAPTAAWIREADASELRIEVADAWILALNARPSCWDGIPAAVRAYLAVDTMLAQSRRNGLSSFVREDDPRLVASASAAAVEMGLSELADLFARATAGLDLGSLARTGARPVRWSDARAARAIEDALLGSEIEDRLVAWMREHAEAFAQPIPQR